MTRIILVLFFTTTISSLVNAQNTKNSKDDVTVYYLVRHAEKDRTNPQDKNPNLTTDGVNRAKNWKDILSNISFDMVYATNYNRTKQTALPVAESNNLSTVIYEGNNLVDNNFFKVTKGKKVFIVGHSNTVPEIVNKLIGQKKYSEINDSENGSLFIVTKRGEIISEQLLIIN